ncbi:diguanylate cyclase [Ureibacillus sp. MALMAid1270]|uniref:diguanylate cyclase n=1 Tax=Ureibacillus sp. MALMAid1270 TaxID=3411629 RepID=UPI003BA79A81
MRIRSLGKLGKSVFYTLTVSTVFIIITVILSVMAIRSYLNENILGQRALDHIEESSNHLYRSLIDQETGVRGYHLTNDETFLEPFYYGLEEFEVSKSELTQYIGKFPSLSDNVKLFIEKGESWENLYGVSLIEMINSGNQPTLQQIREGKVALDEFRTNFSDFNEQIEAERTIVRNKMQNGIKNTLITLVSVIVVIVICILFLHIQLLKSVINPIIRLNSCVKSYTEHDFSTNVPEYKIQSIACEPNCFVARYGGEEFSIIMLHEKEEEALVIAERIRKAIEQLEIRHETSLIHNVVTVSSGVVTLVPKGELQLEEVFSKADKALYESKQKGRNQVIKYILA